MSASGRNRPFVIPGLAWNPAFSSRLRVILLFRAKAQRHEGKRKSGLPAGAGMDWVRSVSALDVDKRKGPRIAPRPISFRLTALIRNQKTRAYCSFPTKPSLPTPLRLITAMTLSTTI